MVVWSGWGLLTPLVAFITIVIFTSLLGNQPYAFPIAILLAAVINWFLGKRLNSGPSRVLTDEQTGEQVILKKRHTLFWIQMEYWSAVLIVFGIYGLFK